MFGAACMVIRRMLKKVFGLFGLIGSVVSALNIRYLAMATFPPLPVPPPIISPTDPAAIRLKAQAHGLHIGPAVLSLLLVGNAPLIPRPGMALHRLELVPRHLTEILPGSGMLLLLAPMPA